VAKANIHDLRNGFPQVEETGSPLKSFATNSPQAEKFHGIHWRISAGFGALRICGKNAPKGRFLSVIVC
jgi:hypothetical protein